LRLARGQLGRTGNNPSVGCVIVQSGKIIGQGATALGGRPHAESVALSSIRSPVDGATVYVTLEPCAHTSERGPNCTDELIKAKIARLVCCLRDPDPRTAGKGFERLREAGIDVEIGLYAREGQLINKDFMAQFGE
jgi:diaminohydroxyphosphoribosylaminopyrimidine deaminase / 5-amino-6-(5-phosphoribosylamino)uracil reductase